MDYFECKINITYRWWDIDGFKKIDKIDLHRLKIIANHFLANQIKLGFIEGKMPTEKIREKTYKGTWLINETQKEE